MTDSPADAPADAPGLTCPPSSVPSADLLPYNAPTQMLNACSSTDIPAFVTACLSSTATNKTCGAWQNGASATCLGCLFPEKKKVPTNSGGVLFEVYGTGYAFFEGNQPACIALKDPTNGPACAAAYEPYVQCLQEACGVNTACKTEKEYEACLTDVVAKGGACASYYATYKAAPCGTDISGDAGIATECADNAGSINVVCGTGI